MNSYYNYKDEKTRRGLTGDAMDAAKTAAGAAAGAMINASASANAAADINDECLR